MPRRFPQLMFTDSVKRAQERNGARQSAQRMEAQERDDWTLGPAERDFIGSRDSFYLASVNEAGWPYVQFRGGPRGFLRVLDERTLAYADFRGNRQLISAGNLESSGKAALILLDYPTRTRLKLLARAEVVQAEDQPELIESLHDPTYRARVERAVVLHVEAFDWNCPQHITPRYTLAEIQAGIAGEQAS